MRLKQWAKALKSQLYVLYLAYRDQRVPRPVKLFTLAIVAYAFSPIDLIPDFIPVLGYLDDIILVPLGVYFALKWLPADVLEDARQLAAQNPPQRKVKNWFAAAIIVFIWLAAALLVWAWIAS